MQQFLTWAAMRTVRSRVGTWRGYETVTQQVPEVTRADWATAIGNARAALVNRVAELTRPLNRRPTPAETITYNTVRQSGFLQQIEIFVRDRDTGLIESRPYSVRTNTLMSRQRVVNVGVQAFTMAAALSPDDYPEEVLGAAYAGTFEMIPGG